MRSFRHVLLLTMALLAASCALFTRPYRPPHAPKSEAETIQFHWGWPRKTAVLSGVWLRAVTIAMDDFLPAEAAEGRSEDEWEACLNRRENYHVEAWAWTPGEESDAGDGGAQESDGGMALDLDAGVLDAGAPEAWTQPGMPKAPQIIYVVIGLLPGHCELGGSPVVDMAATYAIDTVGWRILAVHH